MAGKPLIAYAIQTALDSDLIDRVVVSTEDDEIAEIARFWGADAPLICPSDLARDESAEWLTWQHAIKRLNGAGDGFNVEVLVCVSPTSPPLAAMHHGIPGLFHDPTGTALHHRYRAVGHLITHGYDQLRSQVQTSDCKSPRYNGKKEAVWGRANSFIGEYPGKNSTDRFRQILSEIAIQDR